MTKSRTERNADFRANRIRVELLLKPGSPEALALAELAAELGSQAKAVRVALICANNVRKGPKLADVMAGTVLSASPMPYVPPADPGKAVTITKRAPAPAKPKAPAKGSERKSAREPMVAIRAERIDIGEPVAPAVVRPFCLPVGPAPAAPGSRLKGGKK